MFTVWCRLYWIADYYPVYSVVQATAVQSHVYSVVQAIADQSHVYSVVQAIADQSHVYSVVQAIADQFHVNSVAQSIADMNTTGPVAAAFYPRPLHTSLTRGFQFAFNFSYFWAKWSFSCMATYFNFHVRKKKTNLSKFRYFAKIRNTQSFREQFIRSNITVGGGEGMNRLSEYLMPP